ncbi:MAG: adenylyl-sulfate kinase [Eubacterium sp.]|nr:adenylyl-sulfate kinase [Eubacterium sp.]
MSSNVIFQKMEITREMRAKHKNQRPVTIWFTGLSGSGKSTLANAIEKCLYEKGRHTMSLDGDNIRLGINKDLGFSEKDRVENIRRIAEISKLMNDAGVITLTSFISPYIADRQKARQIIGEENFIEVYVSTPIEECEKRDVKGLYKKAREGIIKDFTGVSGPYEEPANPEISIDTSGKSIEESAEIIMKYLRDNNII